jgi:hypothetical protein
MAEEKDEKIASLEARLAALEEIAVSAPENTGQAITTKKTAIKLSGESFTVEGKKYQAVYPRWKDAGQTITEEMLLADKKLQKSLVESGSKLVRMLGAFIFLMFAFSFSAQATSITINPYSVEVLTKTNRDLYQLQEMLIIYRSSTDAFEVQMAETRSKIWGGDVDSVTISGASTTAAKLAYLRTLMLEATTTGGYRVFIGRNSIEYYYNTSTSRLDLKYAKNKQPLWFGSVDSLQSGPSGASGKLAFLRLINRWRAQDCLPTTSVATIAAGAAAGTSPTVSVTGDAFSGSISVTTGTTATTGTLATVTLKITAPTGTRISIDPANSNACLHVARWYAAGTTTTLVITVPTTALSDATAYIWNYNVVPY